MINVEIDMDGQCVVFIDMLEVWFEVYGWIYEWIGEEEIVVFV